MNRPLCLIPVLLAVASATWAAGASPTVVLDGEAIRLVVNDTEDGRGRFAVDVTGGDRQRPDDDGQPLIYGRPVPWTSYTTVRLDGSTYVFGGPTTRRAGKGLVPGELVTPPTARDGGIQTAWRYGDLVVTQLLSIVEGPNTGLRDTARIAYTLANRGEASHRVGLRVTLDTMLGANDGAPFRLGERCLQTDEAVTREALPPYWQAFDSLERPRVIAQGSLAGGELTPPDRLLFTNWGTLADAPWGVPMVAGRDFTRWGEFELDSAVALVWDEAVLVPGEVISRITYYGLGGLTIARGELTLGLTAPASVNAGDGSSFLVLGYLENRGAGVAQDVTMSLNLPESLRALTPRHVQLGRLKPGESRQVAWMIEAPGSGPATIRLVAEAFQLKPVAVERSIRLVAPARIAVSIVDPRAIKVVEGRYLPYPPAIQAVVVNEGGSVSTNARAQLVPGFGLQLASGESAYRLLGPLAPGERTLVTWYVASGGPAGRADFTVLAGSNECRTVAQKGAVNWPELPGQLRAAVARTERPGWYRVDLSLLNLPEAAELAVRIQLGRARLTALQRGGFMVCAGITLPWQTPPPNGAGDLLLAAKRPSALDSRQEVLATLWLYMSEPDPPRVRVELLRLLDMAGRPLAATVVYQ